MMAGMPPNVDRSVFGGPNGIDPAIYKTIEGATVIPQVVYSAMGGGKLMCLFYPSSCLPKGRARRSARKTGGGFNKPRRFHWKTVDRASDTLGGFLKYGTSAADSLVSIHNTQQDRRLAMMNQQYIPYGHPQAPYPNPQAPMHPQAYAGQYYG